MRALLFCSTAGDGQDIILAWIYSCRSIAGASYCYSRLMYAIKREKNQKRQIKRKSPVIVVVVMASLAVTESFYSSATHRASRAPAA